MVQSTNQHEEKIIPAQQTINVAFQGERGAFGDEAVKTFLVRLLNQIPTGVLQMFLGQLPGAKLMQG